MLDRLAFAALFILASCAAPEEPVTYPIRAEIVASDNGDYRLQEVTFKTLTDVRKMKGSIATLLGGASLNVNINTEEIIRSDDASKIYREPGNAVNLDYFVRDGLVIPKNFKSMEMLGLYYAYERTLLFWQDKVGIDFQTEGYPSVYYNPSFSSAKKGQRTEVVLTLNAAYLSGAKDFWFFKTSRREKIPVKMNFGVVAHEFGHFIFDRYFAEFDASFYKTDREANHIKLSGMNEGLADFFSYMVTGSVDEFAASLEDLGKFRKMPVPWRLSTLERSGCEGGFYCKGSILASALHEIANSSDESAWEVGQAVLAALPLLRKDWQEQRNSHLFDYDRLLNRILEVIAAEKRPLYCTVFLEWFDTAYFMENLACD